MSLSVPASVLSSVQDCLAVENPASFVATMPEIERVRKAVSPEVFLAIVRDSLPGAITLYEKFANGVIEGVGYAKLCTHHVTEAEIGHLNRAAFGTAINNLLVDRYGVRLYRVASSRWALVHESRFSVSATRQLLFSLSEQRPHGNDQLRSEAYQDHPDSVRRISNEYPMAFGYLQRLANTLDANAVHAGIESKAREPRLFKELIDALGIWPVRTLLLEHFDIDMVRVNCCGDISKKKGGDPAPLEAFATPAFQLLMQEPNSVDC